ncbi:MAG: HAD family hydrolase [Ktedonobacterales bacterium]
MLFLFDIDGTLLRGMPPVHHKALIEAVRIIFGVQVERADIGQTAGMTDIAITRRMLLAQGIAPDAITAELPAFFAIASETYARLVPDDLRPYRTPHAEMTLALLRERGEALGLVTGNPERIAWIKLAHAGLAEYFHYPQEGAASEDEPDGRPIRCGAFGDEEELRDRLPPLAVERARRLFGRNWLPDEVYVVGDTPADIACGAAHGLRTVAVATGSIHSLDQLRACSPTFAYADLSGLHELV